MNENLIAVPDALGETPDKVENLFATLQSSLSCSRITLDLTAVNWIRPYGAVSLLGVCRYLKQLTHSIVRITGLRRDVHAYLRRIDFFKCGAEAVYTTDSFNSDDDLARSVSSSKVLELFPICVHEDVYEVIARARHILLYLKLFPDPLDRGLAPSIHWMHGRNWKAKDLICFSARPIKGKCASPSGSLEPIDH